jgi:hypothetical protein
MNLLGFDLMVNSLALYLTKRRTGAERPPPDALAASLLSLAPTRDPTTSL